MIDKSLFALPKVGMVMGLLLLFALTEAACVIGQAYALARAITNLWEGGVLSNQASLLAIFAACFIGKQLIQFIRDSFLARFSRERTKELREQLLDSVFGSQTGMVSLYGSAAVTQGALDGIKQVETYLALILPKIVGLIAIPLPLLIIVFSHDLVSGIILLAFFPVIIFFMIIIGRQASTRAQRQYESYNALSNHFIDTLRGIETLKVFGKSKGYGAHIFKSSEDFRGATIETLKVATLSSAVLDLIATLGVAAVSLMLGFRLLDGTMLLFPALLVLIISPDYFKPIRDFAGDFHASLDGKNALKSITSMIASSQEDGETGEVATWHDASTLRFDGVNFQYPKLDAGKNGANDDAADYLALNDISFEARGFNKIGIVGISGSGKTTLVNILGGFAQPTCGTIEANGAALTSLQLPSWQKQLLYIPQNPYIFHASLRDNICFYTPDASEDAVQQAITV
ncbi:MAG: ATP-binding cassette domain-containing protein, partial [Eggerthellaceae bacterium]|nr:ATP-binding cassette domain-containing protein [Eggerthellaceae bacterium]